MPRMPCLEFANAIYHIVARGTVQVHEPPPPRKPKVNSMNNLRLNHAAFRPDPFGPRTSTGCGLAPRKPAAANKTDCHACMGAGFSLKHYSFLHANKAISNEWQLLRHVIVLSHCVVYVVLHHQWRLPAENFPRSGNSHF